MEGEQREEREREGEREAIAISFGQFLVLCFAAMHFFHQ
jgi:hypothetical protein